jgi:dCTP diphosphatase
MNLDAWQERLRQFAVDRDWEKFHTPKNLTMALTVEASELLEVFQWLTPEESLTIMETESAEHVREEVADVLIYLLRLSDVLGIDLERAVGEKLQANAVRYAADEVRGDATKRG